MKGERNKNNNFHRKDRAILPTQVSRVGAEAIAPFDPLSFACRSSFSLSVRKVFLPFRPSDASNSAAKSTLGFPKSSWASSIIKEEVRRGEIIET